MKNKLYILFFLLCFLQTQQLVYAQKVNTDIRQTNQQSETVDFPIDTIEVHNGEIVVTGPNGQTETFPGGKDTVITDSTGNSYYVDANGNVSGPHKQADGGKPTPENTDGVDKKGEVTTLTAEGVRVDFEQHTTSKYAYDKVAYNKALTKEYKEVDGKFVPFKAVPNGLTDKLLARVTISNDAVNADSLFFKTQNGVKVDAVRMQNSNNYVLTLKGTQKFAVEEVQATIKQGDTYKIAGVFNLVHVSPRTVKLKLVPTASNMNVADKLAEVKAIYNQLALNVDVEVAEPFDISSHLVNGKVPTEDEFGDLSTYSSAQKAIISAFTKERTPEQAYYIFVTNATSSTGQGGYMALGNQFGFVFDQSARTIAHEFGHGALRLEHPFKQYKNKGLNKGNIQSIMDYAQGTELLFTDWKQINDPKFRFYAFQGQSEGEFAGIRLTPDWTPFEYIYSFTHGNSDLCNNNGGICTIVKDEKTYTYKNGDYYNEDTPLGIQKLPNHTQEVIVVNYLEGCGKLYKVKLTDLKASKFNINTDLDFANNIFTFIGDISCEGNNSGSANGTQSVKSNLTNLKKYFGNDVEFAKDGKVYKLNTREEVEEVSDPLTNEQINNGEWTENKDYNKRFSSDKNGNLKLEAFGFKSTFKNIDGKTINREIVSENIRNKTNVFLQENNVKDLNTNYSSSTEAFADGSSIKIEGEFGKVISEGIDVTTDLLKTGELKEQTYRSDSNASIKAPGLVTGSVEVVAQKVTDITSLGVLIYDVAIDEEVRTGLTKQFKEIKNQVGENPKEFFPILGDVILTVTTGNTPEDWNKSLNSKDNGERSHLATRGVGNSVITLMSGAAIVKDLPEIADKLGDAVKKGKLGGRYDWGIVKKYFQHIQEVTGRQVHQKQIDKLKDALRNKEYSKLDRDLYKKHSALFTQEKRIELIKEWETNTGQKWPTYTEPYYTKSGNLYKEIGDPYDAHHIIEQNFGGEHEWWNMHPAKFPDEHQGGIHGSGSPSKELFK